jgi:stage III sporulation protein SpoIIIAA
LREVTRLLAKEAEVMIVDTVNEIAGDGDVPHPCVGEARRMMEPTLLEQGSIMEECIQNHSPNVIVVDKLGHPDEVEVARTCKDQEVRLIASMSGNLRKIVKNGKLRGLLGVESAGLRPGSKSTLKRTGPPVFDVVVELCPGTHHEWKIVLNTADAVDKILAGEKYQCQHRVRNSNTGSFSMKLVDA